MHTLCKHGDIVDDGLRFERLITPSGAQQYACCVTAAPPRQKHGEPEKVDGVHAPALLHSLADVVPVGQPIRGEDEHEECGIQVQRFIPGPAEGSSATRCVMPTRSSYPYVLD